MTLRSRAPLAALALMVVAGAAAACGDDDDDDGAVVTAVEATTPATTTPDGTAPMSTPPDVGGPGPADSADLQGRTFLGTAVEGHELVPDSGLTLEFGPDGVSGTGGCNRLVAAPWSLEGHVLVVTGPLGMTEMACEPAALMDQDTWLADLLTARPTVAVDGATLTLTSGNVVLTLTDREVADPDRELEGTAWELESLVTADAVSTVPLGVTTPTLTIEAGRLAAHLGCNRGMGEVTVGDGTLEIAALATTRMACEGDAGDVERHLTKVLDGTVEFAIEADQLTLTNGASGAVYRAAG